MSDTELVKTLSILVGKSMPDVNSWQTTLAIILNTNSNENNTISSIAKKSFLTEQEVVASLKSLINSGFKMAKSKNGDLILSVGEMKYPISIAKKKEPVKNTGSMEMFVVGGNEDVVASADIEIPEEFITTEELINALREKNLGKIDVLLVDRPRWDYTNDNNESVLSMGCSKNDIKILDKLIESGLDPQDGLMWACQNGNAYRGLIAFFVKHGANVNTADGLMPLQWAIFTGAVGMAQELIEKGADVNFVSESGEPLLQTAVDSDNKQVVELMIMHDANVNLKNSNGDGPLHWAATTGALDVVRMLLYNGADPKMTNNDGKTPRDLSITLGKDRIAKVLAKY